MNKTNAIMMSQDDSSKGHILVVGHVTRDIFEDRQQLGGGATYAAQAASAFGCRISLVTASPASSLLKPLQDDRHITLHRKKCHEFTTFILNRCGVRRELSLVSRAPDLTPEDIPESARTIPLAYIAPVIGECGRAIIESLDSMKIVIGAQGWLRQVDDRGEIVPHLLPDAKTMPDVHVIVFSEQDFPNAESIASRFSRSAEVVALTRGAKGVTLLSGGEKIELQPREYALLEFLMRNTGSVVTKTLILEKVWGYNFDPQTNVVDVLVSRLRSRIDKDFDVKLIRTVRGVGYVLEEPR